ncbi:hypothetical protein Y032_0012g1689 [Ancylostoma ceylanicum]|uniref:Uncharacterized protein n=1 Tax=Ancylostoma ceylanicum TaxID=53326 RepID=A0A016VDK8_9BILA|nr:hypothetical protein Y032_0012g1689 [Ancylostoma ceylanicum]
MRNFFVRIEQLEKHRDDTISNVPTSARAAIIYTPEPLCSWAKRVDEGAVFAVPPVATAKGLIRTMRRPVHTLAAPDLTSHWTSSQT